jgi:hypothetical protein
MSRIGPHHNCARIGSRSYEQWALSWEEALGNETRRGLEVQRSGESIEGTRRFAAGHGRHGSAGVTYVIFPLACWLSV